MNPKNLKELAAINIVSPDQIPRAEPTPTDDLFAILRVGVMLQQLCDANNGIGLSAVQAGVAWKLFVVKRHAHFEYLVNAEYEPVGDEKITSLEGCLSLHNQDGSLRVFEVRRFKKIRVRGQRLLLEPNLHLQDIDEEMGWDGSDELYYGIVYQHEIDHHRGILISDFGKEIEIR